VQWRTRAGGAIVTTKLPKVKGPVALKIQRVGNSFTAYYSVNGKKWIKIGGAHPLVTAAPAETISVTT
jgi:hypothetical protein